MKIDSRHLKLTLNNEKGIWRKWRIESSFEERKVENQEYEFI